MSIFQRIGDIISANLNDLTEGFENPEQMLRQAINEMEQSIAHATGDTARALASAKTIAKELKKNQDLIETWHQRAEKAVAAGDDDLARRALKRKQEHENLVAALEDQLKLATETGRSLRRQLDAMKAKLAEAQRSLATLSARHRAANFRKKMQRLDLGVSTQLERDAFARFDRLRSKVERAEAEAEAYAELNDSAATDIELDQEFEVDRDVEIDAQLAQLKEKVAG